MNYIVFDLEFNQDFSSLQNFERQGRNYPYEIIQIGAVKLNDRFDTTASFQCLVKPTFYSAVNPFITELTGISTEQLQTAKTFPEIFPSFIEFIGNQDPVFCVWGMADMKELFRNASYHRIENKLLPNRYINIQPYVSLKLGLPKNRLLRLRHSIEAFGIPIRNSFHDALNDACYTAELFKKIYQASSIQPKTYSPSYSVPQARPVKRRIDFDQLIKQFEKMYGREMTQEEQHMIKLAYQMGKTRQFLKES